MRVPIPIFSQRRRQLVELPGKCPSCGADGGFGVEREEVRLWVAFLPMGASETRLQSRCLACGAAAPPSVLAKRPRAHVLIRFGWLFFLVIPLVSVGTWYFVDSALRAKESEERQKRADDDRRAKEAAAKERSDAEKRCADAYAKLEAAKNACMAAIDKQADAISSDIDKEKPKAPVSASKLAKTPVVVTGDADVPEGPWFGGSPCPAVLDPDWRYGGAAVSGYTLGKPLDEIRAKTKEMLGAAAKLTPAERFAVVTFGCNDFTCTSTAAFFDGPSKALVAVARATMKKSDKSDFGRAEIAQRLATELGKWK